MTPTEVALDVRTETSFWAIPLPFVSEVMRPLPVDPLPAAPVFVRGLSVIRGRRTVVVDLHALLSGDREHPRCGRFVVVRGSAGPVALAVDAVLGVSPMLSVESPDAGVLRAAAARAACVDEGLSALFAACRVSLPADVGVSA